MASTPEFSRPISIEGITPDKLRKESVEATEEECAALAQRFDLRSLSGLTAKLGIRRIAGGATVRVEGDFEAEVVQACVVSLRDVPSLIKGHFDTYFTEEKTSEGEIEFTADDPEEVADIISRGQIDLGEVVAQSLALEIDPYPRAPGVSLAAQLAETGVKAKHSPFQVLEEIKKKKD